ncbi:hypothetical protein V7S43_017304 [Phytophthora oleae]|uniref:BZIP domain-containing protein n=1 Tax=Phytophthora oleae TaxID=2107226 RepID=A0ABD3EWQ5_9STRA
MSKLPSVSEVIQSSLQAGPCVASQLRDFDTDQPQPKQKRIRPKTQRRREQCRAKQARYRQKQLDHAKSIEDSPERNRLLYGGQQSVWNVVVKYFHTFRFGVPVPLPQEEDTEGQSQVFDNAEMKHQLAFLRSCMTEDWRLYSSTFQSLYFQLEKIERTSDRFVSVSATLSMTVSETTLEKVFPLLEDRSLCSRLLGWRLQFPCSLSFEWDVTVCRVSRLEATMNFMTPLMRAVGNLNDIATVLENALILHDGTVAVHNN